MDGLSDQHLVGGRLKSITLSLREACDLVPDRMSVNLRINLSNAEQYSLDVNLTLTVGEFKSYAASKIGIRAHQQQIIYRGRILDDDMVLNDCGLQENAKIHFSCLPPPPQMPGGISKTSELSTYPALSGRSDMDHLSSIAPILPSDGANCIELYRKTFLSTIEVLVRHYPLTDTMEFAVGKELHPVHLDYGNLKTMAKDEYIRDQLSCVGAAFGTVSYRQELLQNANWLENYLVLSYTLERLEVCQTAIPSERSEKRVESPPSSPPIGEGSTDRCVKYELRFLPRSGDETCDQLLHIPPTSSPVFLTRASHCAYRDVIDRARGELKGAVEGLAAVLPSPTTHKNVINQQGSMKSTPLGARGRPILAETHHHLLEECAASNLRRSFRLKYLNHLRHFVCTASFSENTTCAGLGDVTMGKTEILKRLEIFRVTMNTTAHKGIFGKLIVSDLSESKHFNPSETLRRKQRAQYHRERTTSSSTCQMIRL